jgi:hypothetical protein
VRIMCLKGKIEAKKKPGRFECKECGAVSKEKDNMCKPVKIKEKDMVKSEKKVAKKKDKKKTKKKDKKKDKKKKNKKKKGE